MAIKRRITVKAKPAAAAAPSTVRKPLRRVAPTADSGTAHMTGSAGFQRAKQINETREAQYEKQRATPYRLRLKPKEEEVEIVILDPVAFFVREHTFQQGKNWVNEVCIMDTGVACPLCSMLGKEGSYTLMMTGIDKRQFKTRDGKTIKISKKLVPAKAKNIGKFERIWKKHGNNLRGLVISFSRDTDKESSIGESIEPTGKRLNEAQLAKLGDMAVLPNYEEIFALPSADELRDRYKIDAPVGSESFGRTSGGKTAAANDEIDDSDPW